MWSLLTKIVDIYRDETIEDINSLTGVDKDDINRCFVVCSDGNKRSFLLDKNHKMIISGQIVELFKGEVTLKKKKQ